MKSINGIEKTSDKIMPQFKRTLDMKDCITKLGSKQPFVHFDLKLTDEEKIAWAKLNVKKAAGYRNFGDLQYLRDQVKKYLQSLGNNHKLAKIVANSIDSLIHEIVSQFSEESALVIIGSSLPNKFFDIPRWHADGYYVPPHISAQFKIVIVLKGPHTLFYNLPNELRDQFMKLQELNVDMFDLRHRKKIAKLIDPTKIDSPTSPIGSVFVIGADYSAIHSEPKIDSKRIFMSIFPCSIEKLKEKERAQKKFEKTTPKDKKNKYLY